MGAIGFKLHGEVPSIPIDRIATAFETAMAFTPERARDLCIDRATMQRFVEEEAAFGRVVVDDKALTAGARLHAIQPARHVLAEWKRVRKAFELALEPKRADIDAVVRLDTDVAMLRNCARDELGQVVETWRLREQNKVIERDWSDAKARYDTAKAENLGRTANLTAHSLIYAVTLLMIGLADWLINYDTFFAFTGVPAIAAGATAIIGLLLAFGAHGHGEMLKQWSNRFGAQGTRGRRMGSLRLLALATFSLVVVLLAAGGSRYAVAMHAAMPPQSVPNILGAEAMVDASPVRDVLLSLLANVGAWVVGVFVSYLSHDVDPDFMDAAHQHRVEARRYRRARRGVSMEIEALEQQCSREVVHLQVETLSRGALVAQERAQLAQVMARETAVIEALVAAVRTNAEEYRDMLAQYAMARRGAVQVFLGHDADHRELSPYDFMALDVMVDADMIASLVP